MIALVKKENGYDQMELENLPVPKAKGREVLIQVAYCGICGTDLHAFRGNYSSTKPPVVLGHEFSGVVAAVGEAVGAVKIGDRVTSETTFSTCGVCPYCKSKDYNLCGDRQGIGTQINGGMAEYVLTREESVHILPNKVELLAASLTEPLACGVHACLEKGDVRAGEVICVFGAGAIGLLLAQVAKAQGAVVILAGMPNDAERFVLAKKGGVDYTINQMEEDIKEVTLKMTGGWGVDKAFECSGAVQAANKAIEVVRKKGRVVQMGVFSQPMETISTDLILHKEVEYIGSRSQKPSSWVRAIEMMERGQVHPEYLIHGVTPLQKWREAFDTALRGEGAKGVLLCKEGIK